MAWLYHGTSLEKLPLICKAGLKVGSYESCNIYVKERGFLEDCIGNISLAVSEKDAVFFAAVACHPHMKKGEPFPTQAIIRIDSSKLDPYRMVKRDLFDKKDREVKYFKDIPLEAIESILLREFRKGGNVLERRARCEEFRKGEMR